MADSQSLGEIVVSIIADTAKLDSGLNKANKSISDFDKSGKKAASNSKDLQKSLDKTGDEAKKAGESFEDVTESVKDVNKETEGCKDNLEDVGKGFQDAGDKAEKGGKKTEDAGNKIKNAGKKSKDAKVDVLNLKGAFNKLAGAFSAVAIIAGIEKVIQKLMEMDQQIVTSRNNLKTLSSSTLEADRYENLISKYNQTLKGEATREQKAEVIISVDRNFGDLLPEDALVELMQQVLDTSLATGSTGTYIADTMRDIMAEYNLPIEQTGAYLKQLIGVAEAQGGGSIPENLLQDMEVLLSQGDMFNDIKLGYEEILKWMISLNDKDRENKKDVGESIGYVRKQYEGWMQETKTAQESIPIITQAIKDLEQEISDAIREGLDTSDLEKELQEQKDELANAQTIATRTAEDFFKTFMSQTDFTGLYGRDLTETKEAREILIQSDKVELPELKLDYTSQSQDSKLTEFGKTVNNLTESVAYRVSGYNDTAQALIDSNNKLYEALKDKTGGLFGGNADLYYELINKYEGLSQRDQEARISEYEHNQNVQKFLIEFDLEKFGGEVTGASQELQVLEEPLKNSEESLKNINQETKTLNETDLSPINSQLEDTKKVTKDIDDNLSDINTESLEKIDIEPLEKLNDIDVSGAVESISTVSASIDGETGINIALANLMTALENGVVKIDSVVIPGNDRLVASNQRVAASYREIAAAKAAAGM